MSIPADLFEAGRSLMERDHLLILGGGALGATSILAGLLFRRLGAPTLLVFLGLGMLAGEDGILQIPFDDFGQTYLIGSVALAVILFEGGLKTRIPTLRAAFWPALLLATIGVALTALIVGVSVKLFDAIPFTGALLVGAAAAPTDAAAIASLLRGAKVGVPERLLAVLEVESGLNDPMSVFLTVLLLRMLADPAWVSLSHAAVLFGREMLGGAVLGFGGGSILALALRRLRLEPSLAPVLVLTAGLALFGFAQMIGTSGFLAIYVAAVITGATAHPSRHDVERFFEGMAWLAQIVLFLMLGLLVTPHALVPLILPGIGVAAVLIVVARPVAVAACLLPLGYSARETAFASWVGLRGAAPIYLSIIPALADPGRDAPLFSGIFVVVIASLVVQGWTIAPAARLLGYGRRKEGPGAPPLGSPPKAGPLARVSGDGVP